MTITVDRVDTLVLGSSAISCASIRDLYMLKVLSKTAYIAIMLRMDQPTQGGVHTVDVESFAEEHSFTDCLAGQKEKEYKITPEEVSKAIADLASKGALQTDAPRQIQLGLMF